MSYSHMVISLCTNETTSNKFNNQLFRGVPSQWETSRCVGCQWGSDRMSSCRQQLTTGLTRPAALDSGHVILISSDPSLAGLNQPPSTAASNR